MSLLEANHLILALRGCENEKKANPILEPDEVPVHFFEPDEVTAQLCSSRIEPDEVTIER